MTTIGSPPCSTQGCGGRRIRASMEAGEPITGAESVLRTLAAGGVRACFANPGTSEMHLVAALDRVPEVRPVLTLFEGVASGAADGYGRMAGKPAATLLHLGPGLGNAFANLHNAYKARTPMVNLVGDHATAHAPLGAPLATDIASIARPVSHWLASTRDARSAATDAAAALAAARAHGIATLILPADAGWGESAGPAAPLRPAARPRPAAGRRHRRRGPRAALRRPRRDPDRRRRDARRRAARRRPDRRRHRRAPDPRHLPGAVGARRGRPRRRAPPLPDRDGDRVAQGPRAPDRRGHPGARRVLRLPRQAEPAGRPRHRRDHARLAHRGRRRRRSPRSPTSSARTNA